MNSFTRLLNASRESIRCELSRQDSPERFTILGVFVFNRVTAEFHVTWTVDCSLPLLSRISEILRFLNLCKRL